MSRLGRTLGGIVLLAACGAHPSSPQDRGGPCDAAADPDPPTDFNALLERLDTQGHLCPDDQAAIELEVARFHSAKTVWCDQVYRLSSSDGLWFEGLPERIRPHASVPDVAITPAGSHLLAFVELDPDRFMETLRDDPAEFWRQGLVGLGGLGIVTDEGSGFEDVAFDAHLSTLQEVVDPDLGVLADGAFRLAWYAVPVGLLPTDSFDPYRAAKPHLFYRTTSTDLESLPEAPVVVSCSEGDFGEADPTLLSLPDGGEILYAGAWEGTAMGWSSVDGATWDSGGPDVDSALEAASPDAVPDGEGGYRMYFTDTASHREVVATSADGLSWSPGAPVMDIENASGGTVARAPDGTWWIYFNMPDPLCVAGVEDPPG